MAFTPYGLKKEVLIKKNYNLTMHYSKGSSKGKDFLIYFANKSTHLHHPESLTLTTLPHNASSTIDTMKLI